MRKLISLVSLCSLCVSLGRRARNAAVNEHVYDTGKRVSTASSTAALVKTLLAINPAAAHSTPSTRRTKHATRREPIFMEENQGAADRLAAIVPYLLPSIDVYARGIDFYNTPVVGDVAAFWFPIVQAFQESWWISLLLFIGLNTMTQNPSYPTFLRFNIMQALILDILLILAGFLAPILGLLVGAGAANDAIYICAMAVILYSIGSISLGNYPDKVPVLSDAAKMQIGKL